MITVNFRPFTQEVRASGTHSIGYRVGRHNTRSGQCGGERLEVIRTPRFRDVRDPKLSRERIILIEVMWYVQVNNQIFTFGVVEGGECRG